MGKRIRRNRKRTKKRTKKGGMKKTTPTQFKESRLELKRMLKDKEDLDRVSSSSSDELSPKTEYLWKRAMPQKGEVGKDTSEIKEYIDRRLNEQKEALNERLVKRGNEQELAIKHRLKRFETEMQYKDKFDYAFINKNLKKTIEKVEKLIKGKIK